MSNIIFIEKSKITANQFSINESINTTLAIENDYKTLIVENVTKLIGEEELNRIKKQYQNLYQNLDVNKNKIVLKADTEDLQALLILNKINTSLIKVLNNNKNIFQFFKNYNFKVFHLYDNILIIEYIKGKYFFYNIQDNFHQLIETKHTITTFLLDTTTKLHQCNQIIFIIKCKNNKFLLKKYNFNKFLYKDQITHYTSIILNDNSAAKDLESPFEFKTLIELNSDSSHFIIVNKSTILLFEQFEKVSVLLKVVDIRYSIRPLMIDHYLVTSEHFVYRLSLTNKAKNTFSIFKDMTLNFNSEKYREMLETVKLIVYYNMEEKKVPFVELKNYMNNIFQEYDIFSYVENLSHSLNEENIIMFLSYNLNNQKLMVIFIFCLIFENYKFLTNLFRFLILNEKESKTSLREKWSVETNLNFISYLTLFEDFIIHFFNEFELLNLPSFMNGINEKIFGDLYNCRNIVDKYIKTNLT